MSKMKRNRIIQAGILAAFLLILFFLCFSEEKNREQAETESDRQKAWESAQMTPTEPYPELVEYTLAKLTACGNLVLPEGDDYENNAYTRFLREKLNVQNKNVIEVSEDDNYDLYIRRLAAQKKLPDVMLVNSMETLEQLVRNHMLEDLTDAYENCTSDRIKEIYASYGDELLDSVTFAGDLMALPATQIDYGCSMFWVRDDWRKQLNLPEPKTLEDVEKIVLAFRENEMGGAGNIGLACSVNLVGEGSSNYSMDPVFASFHAYPQVWLKQSGDTYVYGSLTEETRNALEFLHSWYEKGVIDSDYMMRTSGEIGELVKQEKCGAFFGWWWAPNNPLMSAVKENSQAEWRPYLITDDEGKVNSYKSVKGIQYVVVRKGYEHPEVIMKIMTALFDNARFLGESTPEIDAYQEQGVDITARPLVINCDYRDAVFRTTSNINGAIRGELSPDSLSELERVYYEACLKYKGGRRTPDIWAAYMSRIEAIRLLEQENITYVNEDYVQSANFSVSQELSDMETLDFMKIITGEEPISYFDEFTEKWKKNMNLENVLY